METINLETQIGNIKLKTPFINASGCWCYDKSNLNDIISDDCLSGGVVTKTMTLNPRKGNPEPRYYHNQHLSANSMGLPNMGFEYYNNYKQTTTMNKPFIYSISTMSLDDVYSMVYQIMDDTTNCDLNNNGGVGIEFNISCPNIVGKGQMGYDTEQLSDFLNGVGRSRLFDISRNQLAIGLKMSPYFDNHQFKSVGDIIKQYPRIDFLTCINGIGGGLVVDYETETSVIKPNNGMGGLGGMIVKPTGLANVRKFKGIFGDKLDIIGCGGVSTGKDAFEYILSGASCVSVGTELVKTGPTIFNDLDTQLKEIMAIKQYNVISDFKNTLKKQ